MQKRKKIKIKTLAIDKNLYLLTNYKLYYFFILNKNSITYERYNREISTSAKLSL